MKEITLSTGIAVKVSPVPQKIFDIVRMRYPDPSVPIMQDTNTATGEPLLYENRNDPEYRRLLTEAERNRLAAWSEAQLLFGLPEVTVPEEWQPPVEDIQYFNPAWQARTDIRGRKLDYIEWELLRNPADFQLVIRTINELAMTRKEVVAAIEDTFPGDLEGQTD